MSGAARMRANKRFEAANYSIITSQLKSCEVAFQTKGKDGSRGGGPRQTEALIWSDEQRERVCLAEEMLSKTLFLNIMHRNVQRGTELHYDSVFL